MDNCIFIPDLSLIFRRAEISIYIQKFIYMFIMHIYIHLYIDIHTYIKINLIFHIQKED